MSIKTLPIGGVFFCKKVTLVVKQINNESNSVLYVVYYILYNKYTLYIYKCKVYIAYIIIVTHIYNFDMCNDVRISRCSYEYT